MMKLILTFLSIIFLTLPAFSTEFNCEAEQKEILGEIRDMNECWEDAECVTIDFGCPWQMAACARFYVSTEMIIKGGNEIEERINDFKKKCISNDENKLKQCKAINQEIFTTHCNPEKLFCVNGRCLNQTQVFMQEHFF